MRSLRAAGQDVCRDAILPTHTCRERMMPSTREASSQINLGSEFVMYDLKPIAVELRLMNPIPNPHPQVELVAVNIQCEDLPTYQALRSVE